MAAIISVLWEIAMIHKEIALSNHANSVGVATRVIQSLYSISHPATRLDGCQPRCTSILSFVASVSQFLF